MSETQKPLATLAAELWDFLGLGPDVDLPELDRVNLYRSVRSAGWKIEAYTKNRDAAEALDAVYAWARFAGGQVLVHAPYRGSNMPSGWQMHLDTQIVVAEVPITVTAILDADAYAEAMGADRGPLVLHYDTGDAESWGYKPGVRKTACGYEWQRDVTATLADVTCETCKVEIASWAGATP